MLRITDANPWFVAGSTRVALAIRHSNHYGNHDGVSPPRLDQEVSGERVDDSKGGGSLAFFDWRSRCFNVYEFHEGDACVLRTTDGEEALHIVFVKRSARSIRCTVEWEGVLRLLVR